MRNTWETYFEIAAREMDPKALLDIALRCPSWEFQKKAESLLAQSTIIERKAA